MKTLLFGLTLLVSISSFATVCAINQPTADADNHDETVAVYKDIKKSDTFLTVIKQNGEVLKNFDVETYFGGFASEEEFKERVNAIAGSKLAAISVDESGWLALSIGTVSASAEKVF